MRVLRRRSVLLAAVIAFIGAYFFISEDGLEHIEFCAHKPRADTVSPDGNYIARIHYIHCLVALNDHQTEVSIKDKKTGEVHVGIFGVYDDDTPMKTTWISPTHLRISCFNDMQLNLSSTREVPGLTIDRISRCDA